MNADGKADLVLPNAFGSNSLSILLGGRAGTFQPPIQQPVGFEPRGLILSDFNGDSKLDLVTTDWSSDMLCLLAGKGDGTFLPAQRVPVHDLPAWVASGDFNGDGKLDLVTANLDGDSVSVFLGRGDGAFESPKDFEAGNLPVFVAVADLNGDHHLDLVVAHEQGAEVDVLLGAGDGTFRAPVSFKAGAGVRSVAIADLNGDGWPDLATANIFDGTVSVLLNTTGTTNALALTSANPQSTIRNPQSEMPRQEPRSTARAPSPGEYRVDNWTTDAGLPQNTVQCLLQTHEGYLWIGTQSGLARYDGLHFTVFDRNNTPAFKNDNILCLAEGEDHDLWIGTSEGFLRLRDRAWTYFSTAVLSPPNKHVWAICVNRHGGAWVGVEGVLADFDSDQLTARTNFHPGRISSLSGDNLGRLWVAGEGGLFCVSLDPQSWVPSFKAGGGNPADGANSPCLDTHGNLWFGNASGLWRWKDGRLKVYGTKHGLSPGIVSSIAEDAEGALWLAVGDHVNRFHGGQFTQFDSKTGLPADGVRCVYPDREGNVWLGTSRSGLVRLRARRLANYTTQDGLVDDDVWSICEGRAGDLWFGTAHGLSRFEGEKFTNYPNAAFPVFQDRSGTVWSQLRGGLVQLRRDKGEIDAPHQWPPVDDVYVASLYQDRAGALWAAVGCGLWRLKGSQCDLYMLAGSANTTTDWVGRDAGRTSTSYTLHTNGLPGKSSPVGILEDYAGNLWIGSKASGLHRFRDGRFTTLTTSNGLTSDFAAPLLADPDGVLWIGSDKGLNRLKAGRVTRYTTAEGLAENFVGNLLEDDAGWLWTMGHHGIHRMRKQELNEFAEGKRQAIQTISYGEADGMLSSEGNVGVFPNTCQTPDGLLWFPTTHGVVVVEPHQMEIHDRPPPIVLEQVLADDEIIFGDGVVAGVSRRLKSPLEADKAGPPPDSQLSTINHQLAAGRAQLLEFRYTANTFVAPEKTRFRYQLVGHDPDWRDAGLRRAALYTDLAPGAYRFRVVAINSHGVESEAPAEFAFSLAPFFYQTRGFYAASALAVLLIGLGLHRVRVGRLARRQALEQQLALALQRERIAKDMHDDLGASLTQIGLLSEHARRDPQKSPAVAADVAKIADAARLSAQVAEEIVWTVDPRHDTLDSLATYLCQFAREYLETTALRCRLDVPEFLPDLRVPSDVRHNLVLFAKGALNNAVKHAAAQQVTVALRFENRTLTLTVTDDGRGFDWQNSERGTRNAERPSAGNGLGNMRRRVEAIGGQFELWSQPGKGTRVQAVVRLDT